MKRLVKGGLLSLLITLSIVLSSLGVLAAEPATYSTSKNSGTRHEVCTSLSGTSAGSYYTGSNSYDTLAAMSESELLSALRTLMKSTHKKQTSYSDCKSYADETDCENGDGRVVLLYTSYSATSGDFDGSSPGWNREHVWPKSLGGFDTAGPGADLHHIRPDNVKTNGTRGNKKFGNVSGGSEAYADSLVGTKVSGGTYNGSYFEPHDNVKGDVARICLYVWVRWGGEYSKCKSITNVFQDVDTLLEWCELDPVDTWEMGRNEVVEEIQGNRNVFIDYPELAWVLFDREIPSDMTTPSGKAGGNTSGGTTPDTPVVPDTPDTPVVPDTPDTPVVPDTPTVPDEGECRHENTELRGAIESTCAKKGYTGDLCCKDCDAKLEEGREIDILYVHKWGYPVVVTPATEAAEGLEKTTCTECGKSYETAIPKKMPTTGCAAVNLVADLSLTTAVLAAIVIKKKFF